LESARC